MVTFVLGADEFGLDVLSVEKVLGQAPLVPLPGAPPAVEGTLEVRGVRIPVIDLRRHFGAASVDAGEGQVIVTQAGPHPLALMVDAVREVIQVPVASISPPPPYFRGLALSYIRGIARRDERLVILLDSERILSGMERTALVEAMGWSGTEEDSFVRSS